LQQPAAEFEGSGALVVGHEAEVPDANKVLREHVQYKPANKLLCGKGHRALHVAVSIIPPTKRDVVTIECEQAMGLEMATRWGITAKITQHLLGAAKWRFDVNDPWMPV
jgi:hypothetical protein